MHKKHLALISLILFVCLIAFSCRRDIENLMNDQIVTSQSLENARIWHAQHAKDYKSALRPIWADSWTIKSSSGDILVVPAPEHEVNSKDISIRRLFVFTLSGNGVSNGVIIEFLGEKYDVSKHLDNLVANAQRESIEGFTGKIFKYDINYQYTGSAVFENGVKLDARSRLTPLGRKSLPELKVIANHDRDFYGKNKLAVAQDLGRLANTTGNGQTCTTYRITTEYYSNGVLTDVTITYETVCVPNPPSGNSSGNSSSNSSGSSSSGSQTNPGYGGGPTTGGNPTNPGTPPPNPKDPCTEKAIVNAINRSTSLRNAVTSIKSSTASTGFEHGSVITHTGYQGLLENNIQASSSTTSNSATSWSYPSFHWNSASRTVGYIHSHPNGKAPSPGDVMNIVGNANHSDFAGVYGALSDYKQDAFVTAITTTGNYTVTIKDWEAALTKQAAYASNPSSIEYNYQLAYAEYLLDHPGDKAGASIYALNEVFPGMLNIYRSDPATPNEYTPTKMGRDGQNKPTVQTKDCPN